MKQYRGIIGCVLALALAGVVYAEMADLSVPTTLAGVKASTNTYTVRGELKQIRISNATTPIAGMTETSFVSVAATDFGNIYTNVFITNSVTVFPMYTSFDNVAGVDQLGFYSDGGSNIQGVAQFISLAGPVTVTVDQRSKGTNAYTVKLIYEK